MRRSVAVGCCLGSIVAATCSANVPSPREKALPALPAPSKPVPFKVEAAKGGGFFLVVGQDRFAVGSSYSVPRGPDCTLSPANAAKGEYSWKVQARPGDGSTHRVSAAGKFYAIERTIEQFANRVAVKDTITNKTDAPIGIILKNHIGTRGKGITKAFLAGNEARGVKDIKINPTVFIRKGGLGLGMIALDDVYHVQARGFYEKGAAGIFTDNFALDKGASYTLEWAIYPNASGDYFDFINQVRHDEDRNRVTVPGGFLFLYGKEDGLRNRRLTPPKEFFDVRGAVFASDPCLSYAADDPSVSIEGIEFMGFPKEMELVKQQFATIRKTDPNLKLMFHIAHHLYACPNPRDRFPDSRVLDSEGRQFDYGNDDAYYYTRDYFSKEKLDAGWRWWIFYPTLDNSFGKAMLKSVDVMVDEMGCKGAFMDGFMWTYGSDYTYDRWDGHSADIHPKTKTILRKKGSILLLSQDLLAAYVRKFNSKGGTVIANYPVFTRTIAKEDMVCDQECRVGPDVHLTHTPITLGRPGKIKTELDVYHDVRDALTGGNLYFYYGEGTITYESVPAQMYPFTFQEIHSGYVKGKERLVTLHSGLYGWHNDGDLHFAYLYDETGRITANSFLTTVDASGVRTQVDLGKDQTAVVKKVPISVQAGFAINAHVDQYDAAGIRLVANGQGNARIMVRSGDFVVAAGAAYSVAVEGQAKPASAGPDGVLSLDVPLAGATEIIIKAAK